MPPLVTAVIITFQRPLLLKRAIESVQNQNMSNITIHIFDSASNDGTEKMVEEMARLDSRIIYFRHAKQISAAENYQFGANQVKTPFFSFLADDDFLLPQCYEKALFFLKKYPLAEFFIGSTIDVSLDHEPISAAACAWPRNGLYQPKEGLLQMIKSYINWTAAVYRTKTAQAISLNQDVLPGDFDFMLQLCARYPFAFSSFPCACFTHHEGSFSSSCGMKLIDPSLFHIAERIYPLRPKEEWPSLKHAFHKLFIKKAISITMQKNLQKPASILRRIYIFQHLLVKSYRLYRKIKKIKVKNYLKYYDIYPL